MFTATKGCLTWFRHQIWRDDNYEYQAKFQDSKGYEVIVQVAPFESSKTVWITVSEMNMEARTAISPAVARDMAKALIESADLVEQKVQEKVESQKPPLCSI